MSEDPPAVPPDQVDVTRLDNIDDLLGQVSEWVADQVQVPPAAQAALQDVARSNQAKLSLFKQILAMKKVSQITRLQESMDTMIGHLFDPARLRDIKDIKTMVSVTGMLKDVLQQETAYIERVSQPKSALDPSIANLLHQMEMEQEGGEIAEQLQDLAPEKREAIRNLFTKLQNMATSDGADGATEVNGTNGHPSHN